MNSVTSGWLKIRGLSTAAEIRGSVASWIGAP